ncbi:MAG: SdiA-regulated domain-containing protein [Luteibaculaceae bacterium]
MRILSSALLLLLFLASYTPGYSQRSKVPKLKFERWVSVKIPEPSDICLSPNGNSLYVVSDNGILFETDLEGRILRQSDLTGIDFEGVHTDGQFIYVVDETPRKVHVVDIETFARVRTVEFPYQGGRNKGYEAITFNQAKDVFLLITEKEPVWIFEIDNKLQQKVNEYKFIHKKATDISAATYHNNHLWLLSDEQMTIFKLNPLTYEVVGLWEINVLNPEGIAFTKDGQMIIAADDLERLYYFKSPENANF